MHQVSPFSIFVGALLGAVFVIAIQFKSKRKSRDLAKELGAERERRESSENANTAKAEFLAAVSQEIRTPMNAITGFTDLVLNTELSAEVRQHLEMVRSSADWLMQMVNDMAEFSRIEGGHLALEKLPFKLADCVRSAGTILEPEVAAKNLALTYHVDAQLPKVVLGDATRLRHLIFNLLQSAVKHTVAGGVTVTASLESKSTDAVLVRFGVSDTGAGIPLHLQKAVFDPYGPQTRVTGRPSGVGLSIARKMAELMGGTMEVRSEPGSGTTFNFTAWFEKANFSETLQHLSAAVGARSRKLCVLIAEDNAVNRRLLARIVEASGHEVRCVANGKQAVQLCVADEFDLILMDIEMPDMDGLEATRIIRATQTENANVPIYALTAHVLPTDRDRCISAGMNGFLRKPIEVDELGRILIEIASAEPRLRVGQPLDELQAVSAHLN